MDQIEPMWIEWNQSGSNEPNKTKVDRMDQIGPNEQHRTKFDRSGQNGLNMTE